MDCRDHRESHHSRKHDSERSRHTEQVKRMDKTSSGHRAGIHSATDFGDAERTLKRAREKDLAEFNTQFAGQNEETIYRDKRGRKLDMLNEFMKQQSSAAEKEKQQQAIQEAQYEWGKGSVQRKQLEAVQQELVHLAQQPFARTADDPQLEKARKDALRDGDPMAAYFASKLEQQQDAALEQQLQLQQQEASSGTLKTAAALAKPKYKGPTPPPNRFGIAPGYRWDAVDRGNGFERKIMEKINSKMSFNEDKYKWSVSDL